MYNCTIDYLFLASPCRLTMPDGSACRSQGCWLLAFLLQQSWLTNKIQKKPLTPWLQTELHRSIVSCIGLAKMTCKGGKVTTHVTQALKTCCLWLTTCQHMLRAKHLVINNISTSDEAAGSWCIPIFPIRYQPLKANGPLGFVLMGLVKRDVKRNTLQYDS